MRKKSFDWQTFTRFLPYLTASLKENLFALVFGVIAGGTSVYVTFLIGRAIDQLIGFGRVNFDALWDILWLFLIVILITVFSQWIIQRLGNQVAYQSVNRLRQDTFAHLNQLPLQTYDQTPHGSLMSRFTNDLDQVSVAV